MSTSGAENFIKQAREVQDGELEKFCLRISGFLQNQDLGSEVVDCLRRLYFIIAATKYRRKNFWNDFRRHNSELDPIGPELKELLVICGHDAETLLSPFTCKVLTVAQIRSAKGWKDSNLRNVNI